MKSLSELAIELCLKVNGQLEQELLSHPDGQKVLRHEHCLMCGEPYTVGLGGHPTVDKVEDGNHLVVTPPRWAVLCGCAYIEGVVKSEVLDRLYPDNRRS